MHHSTKDINVCGKLSNGRVVWDSMLARAGTYSKNCLTSGRNGTTAAVSRLTRFRCSVEAVIFSNMLEGENPFSVSDAYVKGAKITLAWQSGGQ